MGNNIPSGFKKCIVCGEYNGKTMEKYLNWNSGSRGDSTLYVTVSCLCNGILCKKCKMNKIHKPISNSYYENTNTVEHWPYFAGMIGCNNCRKQ